MQIIELEQHPNIEFRTDLDDTEYIFRLHYLERFDSWLLDLLDKQSSPIAEGLPVVLNKPLLSQISDARRPAGELMFMEFGDTGASPTFDGFGTRFVLYYLTADEVAAASG